MHFIALAALSFLVVNLTAYLAFWIDKRRAQAGAYRISEGTLLFLAFVGGSAGAKAAQHRFRHKTRKEPFRTQLNGIVWMHAFTAVAAVAFILTPVEWSQSLWLTLTR